MRKLLNWCDEAALVAAHAFPAAVVRRSGALKVK
jgi:hypothetical protein